MFRSQATLSLIRRREIAPSDSAPLSEICDAQYITGARRETEGRKYEVGTMNDEVEANRLYFIVRRSYFIVLKS
jgi:hypothetical protein